MSRTYDEDDARACADYAHACICPQRTTHDREGCIIGPRTWQVVKALALLAERPNDAQRVRVMFHDAHCVSDCNAAQLKYHSKQQSPVVAAIRRWVRQDAA